MVSVISFGSSTSVCELRLPVCRVAYISRCESDSAQVSHKGARCSHAELLRGVTKTAKLRCLPEEYLPETSMSAFTALVVNAVITFPAGIQDHPHIRAAAVFVHFGVVFLTDKSPKSNNKAMFRHRWSKGSISYVTTCPTMGHNRCELSMNNTGCSSRLKSAGGWHFSIASSS